MSRDRSRTQVTMTMQPDDYAMLLTTAQHMGTTPTELARLLVISGISRPIPAAYWEAYLAGWAAGWDAVTATVEAAAVQTRQAVQARRMTDGG